MFFFWQLPFMISHASSSHCSPPDFIWKKSNSSRLKYPLPSRSQRSKISVRASLQNKVKNILQNCRPHAEEEIEFLQNAKDPKIKKIIIFSMALQFHVPVIQINDFLDFAQCMCVCAISIVGIIISMCRKYSKT